MCPYRSSAAAWSACRPRCSCAGTESKCWRWYRDQRPGRPLSSPYGGDPALGWAGGRRPVQVAGAVSAGRRNQQRRVAGGPGDRRLLPEPQRRGRRVQPDGAAIHQPGRARADPAHPGHRARRAAAVPHRVHVTGAGRGRCHGGRPRSGERDGEFSAGEVRRRGRRKPQPGRRTARHQHAWPRPAVAQHHHLLPGAGRSRAAAQRPGTRASTT